ncbi:MAG TPA: transposase, partial [Verrucomicrobiae bacterium]|nr:transposase [Verrucomicrobiae bacterium]
MRQALELWEAYQQKIQDCDRKLEAVLHALAGPEPSTPAGEAGSGGNAPAVKLGPAKPPGRNAPAIERFQQLLARICGGRDVTKIPGLGTYLVLQLISEVGTDMTRWKTEKHFASWLGLAGGRKQSGKRKGRVKAHRN